jgi:K+-transporting ATPase ATPase A chain
MTLQGWGQILLFFVVILALTPPLGAFLHRVLEGERHVLQRPLGWLERLLLRLGGADGREQSWQTYSLGMLAFSAFTMLVTYAVQRMQHRLPFNPQGLGPVEALSAFNTAASFTTNTNWQGYVGESTMSYLSQMAGLAWHNFTSAAAGIAVAMALARGITRRGDGHGPGTVGNFWTDLVRATVYVLLPISFLAALFFVSQGVVQTLAPYAAATTVEGASQSIALGPVASQEAIKQLGTNGGGFMNANSAHPFENPTPLSNLVSMLLIFAIRPRSRSRSAAWRGTSARAGRCSRRWRCCSSPAWAPRTGQRRPAIRCSPPPGARRASATWRARRPASASRAPRSTRR